jgi:hypothetical protein
MSDVPAAAQKKAGAGQPGGDKPRRPPAAAPPEETDAAVEEALFGDDAPPPEDEAGTKPRRSAAIQARRPREAAPLHEMPPSPNTGATDEDDGKPYRVPSLDEERPCPECHKTMARNAAVCTACGYNLQTGKKAVQRFEPVERDWRAGWPVPVRWGVFLGGEAVFVTAAVAGVVAGDAPVFGVFFPWLFFTAMTAFLLGTYDHIHLSRNKKGRVRITKTWTVCFFPRPPEVVDVADYGGVVYGQYDETRFMEWLILLLLLPMGIIPGILWFYFVIFRTTSQVALSRDHGYPEFVLYRGGNQALVREIAETVRDVAHLRYEKC